MFPFTPHTTLRLGLGSGGFLVSGFELKLIAVMLAEARSQKNSVFQAVEQRYI
jgi:hypothetical protein